jgi:thiamine pyrophosphate-dependent acetolactate synthase large subunit-like protein
MTQAQTKRMTGAAAALAQLVTEGVELIVGIPGEHNIPLCDAVLNHPELRFISGRHEQAITFMADGYARASGEVAASLIISGPGVTNSLTALADAYCDSVPTVLICSCCDRQVLGKGGFHELKDQSSLLKSVTKWHRRVETAAEIPQAIHMAVNAARQGRPGPAAVEIPVAVQQDQADVALLAAEPLPHPGADADAIDAAADRLRAARTPLVLIGGGAAQADCANELVSLVEQLNAACFTTLLGKGVVPDNHPLSLGWNLVDQGPARVMLEEADLLLVVGSSLDEVETGRWTLPLPANLIHIDICPEMIGRNYPAAVALRGDAKVVLAQLLEALTSRPAAERPSPAARIAAFKQQILEKVRHKPCFQFVDALQQALPADAMLTNDASLMNGWALTYVNRTLPRTACITRSLAALGFAFPAAVGAKLAYPQRQAVSVSGDGGFLFTSDALATAVQYKLNAVALIFNDQTYGSIKKVQLQRFGRTVGVDLVNPDFVKLAQAYGAAGCRVEQPDHLRDELLRAFERDVPTVIEVPIELDFDMI